jgi:CO/xanthine dehydrogenase FAD-binding subunit
MKRFHLHEPGTIEEACQLLSKYGRKAKILAGGTDLLVQIRKENARPDHVINIKKIPLLDSIEIKGNRLLIGASVTYRKLLDSHLLRNDLHLLREACLAVGTVQVRNVGTLAGNVCNASPSGDTLPALLALETGIRIVFTKGEKSVPIEDFFVAPFQTALEPDEMVSAIEIPLPSPLSHGPRGNGYCWLPKVTKTDETLVGVAVALELDPSGKKWNHARIALGSVAPIPMRAQKGEDFLCGKEIHSMIMEEVGKIVATEIAPRSRADYRRRMAEVLVEKCLHLATERAMKGG